jgi:hypothetical protein
MRVLVAIPHFAGTGSVIGADGREHGSLKDTGPRLTALTACLTALHGSFGSPQCSIDHAHLTAKPIVPSTPFQLEVIICTTRGQHLLSELALPAQLYQHHATQAEPMMLGFECQRVLADKLGGHDFYCYLEDDLMVEDPWLFAKLVWFCGHVGNERLLQPNRFETGAHPFIRKAYVDGDLSKAATARFQNLSEEPTLSSEVLGRRVVFRRPLNPHSGCYFLNAEQMQHWVRQPCFLQRECGFMGPLESAATLGIMRTFKVYKPGPENPDFLEVRHFGSEYLKMIRLPCE